MYYLYTTRVLLEMTGERGVGREPHCACVCVCVCCECAATGETVDSLERQNAVGPISFLNCGWVSREKKDLKKKKEETRLATYVSQGTPRTHMPGMSS